MKKIILILVWLLLPIQLFAQSSAKKFDNTRVVGIANILDSLYTVNLKVDGTATLDAVTSAGNIAGATYGSDASISDAELLTLDDGTTAQYLVGGGAGSAPVWTTAGGLLSIDGLAETNGGIPYGTGDNAYAWLAAGTSNYLLQGNGAGAPSWTNAPTVSGANLTGIPLDGDFGSNGLMERTGAGTYDIATAADIAGHFTWSTNITNTTGSIAVDDFAVKNDVADAMSASTDGTDLLVLTNTDETLAAETYILTLNHNEEFDATTNGDFIKCVEDANGTPGTMFTVEYDGDVTSAGNIAGATYGSNASVSDAELLYVDATSSIQTQLDVRCLESVFGISVGTGLTLDGTALKTHTALQSIAGLTEADVSIIEATADNVYNVVTSGGNNYILGSNADNTALEFKTPANVLTQISAAPLASPTFTGTVGAAAITATGIISDMSNILLDTDPSIVLTAAMCKNMIRFNSDADVIDYTLPSVEAGLVVMFYDIGGGVITIDPYDGTDTIYLNGTALTAGNAIDSPGAVGNFICLIGLDDTRWVTVGRSGTFIDGGAD